MVENNIQYEKCVFCGIETNVPTNTHIEKRKNYIDGCGQLCEKCYGDIYRKEKKKDCWL